MILISLGGTTIKKLLLILCVWLIVSLAPANAFLVEWTPNPLPEKIYQYTLYYYKQSDPTNITKINTTTNSVLIENMLEPSQTYVFYITSWNHELSGSPVESPKSVPINYVIPLPQEDTKPDRPSGISLTLVGVPTKPFLVTSPCNQVKVFNVYVNKKNPRIYSPMIDGSLAVNITGLVGFGDFTIKLIAKNSKGYSDSIEFWLKVENYRKKTVYKIIPIPRIAKVDPTYLGAFKLDKLILEIPK